MASDEIMMRLELALRLVKSASGSLKQLREHGIPVTEPDRAMTSYPFDWILKPHHQDLIVAVRALEQGVNMLCKEANDA